MLLVRFIDFTVQSTAKRKTIVQPRLLLDEIAMFDMPTAILDNTFKTTTPFIDTTVNETLRQVFPFSDNCLLQFFHSLEFSSVIKSLLKGTPDSVIDGIKIRAVWEPYMICQARWNLSSLSPGTQLCYEPCAQARHHAEVPIIDGRTLLQCNRPFPSNVMKHFCE